MTSCGLKSSPAIHPCGKQPHGLTLKHKWNTTCILTFYYRYNGGRGDPASEGGSSFHWRKQETRAYDGLAAGTCVYYADLDGNGKADEHYILGTFTNLAETSLAPSCGLIDRTGDDAGGVVNPNLPIQPASPEGDGDGWRSITCTNPAVTDHTAYAPERWKGVDGDGAWLSVLEGWQTNLTAGRELKHFSNNVRVHQRPFSYHLVWNPSDMRPLSLGVQFLQWAAGHVLRHLRRRGQRV